MRKLAIVAALSLATASCIHSSQVPMTGCDHESGWSDQIRTMAEGAYPYAMLSVNAYDDESATDDGDEFAMGPGWQKVKSFPNNAHDMAYDVWQHATPQGPEIVLAFRGTEFSRWKDWQDGNFGTKQNADGVAAFDMWRKRYPGASFTVTGHSLGGGIATQISLSRENVRSYIFNSSPRFKAPHPPASNPRVSIAEFGDGLKVGRLAGREATQDYYSVGCRGGDPVAQHKSKPLAVCLMQIASWGPGGANEAIARNNLPTANKPRRPGTADCKRRARWP